MYCKKSAVIKSNIKHHHIEFQADWSWRRRCFKQATNEIWVKTSYIIVKRLCDEYYDVESSVYSISGHTSILAHLMCWQNTELL